jgi:MoaA/NifB/PqqE/SkfB family radical SAM enzyme
VSGILILSLVSACACDCVFCGLPATSPHTRVSPEAVAEALDHPPSGERWAEVNLTGGDPLVVAAGRALFPVVLDRRHRYERLSVSTAGVPARLALRGLRELTDPGDDDRPLEVFVSLDGVGEVHDVVRGRPGAFAEAVAFIEAARDLPQVRLALTCVINRHNVAHLDELADFAATLTVPVSYAVVNRSDHYINSLPLYDDVSLSATDAERAIDFLDRRSRQLLDEDLRRVLQGGERHRPCRLLDDGVMLTSEGAVSICGTSKRMVLGQLSDGADVARGWEAALARRPALVAAGAADTCRTCTTNCYARRASDGA